MFLQPKKSLVVHILNQYPHVIHKSTNKFIKRAPFVFRHVGVVPHHCGRKHKIGTSDFDFQFMHHLRLQKNFDEQETKTIRL